MKIVVALPTLVVTFTKKKCIIVIFGKFKRRNPRAVGFFRRILDQNVVVHARTTHIIISHRSSTHIMFQDQVNHDIMFQDQVNHIYV